MLPYLSWRRSLGRMYWKRNDHLKRKTKQYVFLSFSVIVSTEVMTCVDWSNPKSWFSTFCRGVLADLPTKRFVTFKMGASVFSSISMGFWSEILYPTGFPVKSQKLNIWAQWPSWKTAQTLWILVSQVVTESSQFLGYIVLKIETTREITKCFFTQKKIKSHLPNWLSFSHSASHWKGTQEKLFFTPVFHLRLSVPHSSLRLQGFLTRGSWQLCNIMFTFYKKYIIIWHQIKLLLLDNVFFFISGWKLFLLFFSTQAS